MVEVRVRGRVGYGVKVSIGEWFWVGIRFKG